MWTDLKNALRALRVSPGTMFTAWMVLTLAIAAATVTFSVVDHVAVRRLPFPADDRLISVSRITNRRPAPDPVAPQDYFSWQAQTSSLEAIGAVAGWSPLRLTSGETPVPLVTFRATSTLFDVLRVQPVLGRAFGPEHERAGGDQVAIISDAVWRRHFNADPGIVGRPVTFGKETREILGVMPPAFTYPVGLAQPTDAWIPLVPRPNERDPADGGRSYMMRVVGRLEDGSSLEQARAEIERTTAAMSAQYPSSGWKDARVAVSSLHDFVVGPAKGWLLLVLGAVLLVLLIACANVANLLLARSTVRRRELAMRAALGASSRRLLRTAIVESLLLSAAAAGASLVVAFWGVAAASSLLPAGIPRASAIALDARVLMVSVGAAVTTGLLFGIVPAWQASRTDLIGALKGMSTSTTASPAQARWRSVFVVAEVAIVVAMVFATTLFVTSFRRVVSIDLGLDYRHRVAFSVSTRSFSSATKEERPKLATALFDDVIDRVSRVPGVRNAALIDGGLPLSSAGVRYPVSVPGRLEPTESVTTEVRSVTPTYRETAGLRLVEGRFLEKSDRADAPLVVVLNDVAARRLFPNEGAVGRSVTWFGETTVVGVVKAVRLQGPEVEARPELYVATAQGLTMFGTFGTPTVLVQTDSPPERVMPAIVAALAPTLPAGARPPAPQDLEKMFRGLTADRRFSAGMMSLFGGLALVIGAIGIYGVMAFLVTERTRDIGVRMALGASRGTILRSVLAQTSRYLSAGLAVGLAAAWATSGLLASVLFGVTPTETMVYAVVIAVVTIIGVAAALIPAARASRVDPLTALRSE